MNQDQEKKQFQERIFYSSLLVNRISSVLTALDFGGNGIEQLSALKSILIPEVRASIHEFLGEIRKEAKKKITTAKNNYNRPNILMGLFAEDVDYSILEKRDPAIAISLIQRESVKKELTTIIDELHKRNLLLISDRAVEIGSYYPQVMEGQHGFK